MSDAESRRERLKQQLRSEITQAKVSSTTVVTEPPAATLRLASNSSLGSNPAVPAPSPRNRTDSPLGGKARSQLFIQQFSGSGAVSCMHGQSEPIKERPASPRRLGSTLTAAAASVVTAPPVSARVRRHTPPAPVVPTESHDLYGHVLMSNQPHHKRIIFPAERVHAANPITHDKLWTQRPLADGTRFVPSKRLVPQPCADSTLPENPITPRSGRRVFAQEPHIEGCGMSVKQDPREVPPHRVDKFHSLVAPYREFRSDGTHEPNDGPSNRGLLGFAPTGRRSIDVGHAGNITEHKDGGWGFTDRDKRGPAKVEGRTEAQPFQTVLYRQTPETAPPKEATFRPSLVVMSGPPSFQAPPPPPRSNSPTLRYNSDRWTSDLFHVGPAPVNPSPVRRGRSPGIYSPLRGQSPATR